MPPTPRSPRPRMRSPSVTTMNRTSVCGQLPRISLQAAPRRDRQIQAARRAKDVIELLARLADRRRVDDRHEGRRIGHQPHRTASRFAPAGPTAADISAGHCRASRIARGTSNLRRFQRRRHRRQQTFKAIASFASRRERRSRILVRGSHRQRVPVKVFRADRPPQSHLRHRLRAPNDSPQWPPSLRCSSRPTSDDTGR